MAEALLDFSNVTVLVVDGNRHGRWLMKEILRGFGIRKVFEADDGADGLKILQRTPIDLIITEMATRPLGGLELVRTLRTAKDSPTPFVPVLMVSAYTEKHNVIAARDAGINEFLAKPFSARSLYARLRAIALMPRDFVRSRGYVGPDRRRRELDLPAERERRAHLVAALPSDRPLTDDEIDLVMDAGASYAHDLAS